MSETEKKMNKTSKKLNDANRTKEQQKEVLERAKRIRAAKKRADAEKAIEERKKRIAKRKEIKKAAEKLKNSKEVENNKKGEIKSPYNNIESVMVDKSELINIAVTSRIYSTKLTEKFTNRKFWINPSPYFIQSYIPGTIISINCKENKVVKEGEQLLVLEAMKMQNSVEMPFTARIKSINVKVGERIPKDYAMIELEPIS